ncbi:MAG: hypothetical protein RMM53_10350, partial [Bacteroidia bacterium]|nr:hypothetical protein [Bacteroidia bacterium]
MGNDQYRQLTSDCFFARAEWWDATAGDWRVVQITDGEGIVAAFPFAIRKKWIWTRVEQPSLTPRVPVFFRPGTSFLKRRRLLSQLIERLPRYDE